MPVSAPDVTKALFGGVFDVDGSGHYPGLELINLIVCCAEGVLPQAEKIHVFRAAHDFARQLITDVLPAERRSAVLLDGHTEHAVAHLLRCLELEVPNIVKSKGWERTHFFPNTRSLVHWDARKGRQAGVDVQLERRYLRGAGAYAFKNCFRYRPGQWQYHDRPTVTLNRVPRSEQYCNERDKHSHLSVTTQGKRISTLATPWPCSQNISTKPGAGCVVVREPVKTPRSAGMRGDGVTDVRMI